MLTAAITALLGYGYARLEARLAPAQLLVATLAFLLGGTGLLYGALWVSEAPWLTLGLMVWKDVQWVFAEIEFWALAGLLFNVRQGKRLFGLIGTGAVTASIAGGFSMPLVVQTTGTLNLLLLSVVSLVAALGVLLYTIRRFTGRFAPSEGQPERQQETSPMLHLFQERYIGLFFSLSILAILGYCCLEYVFYDQLERAFLEKDALASFFGRYFAILGLIELTSNACVSGPLLLRYGLSFGLLALPVMNTLTTEAAIATGVLFGSTGLFLWAVVGLKLVDEVLRNSLQTLTFRLLYQPLPEGKRLRIQAVRESIVEPLAVGFSGVILLSLTSGLAFEALQYLAIAGVLLRPALASVCCCDRSICGRLCRPWRKSSCANSSSHLGTPRVCTCCKPACAVPRRVLCCTACTFSWRMTTRRWSRFWWTYYTIRNGMCDCKRWSTSRSAAARLP